MKGPQFGLILTVRLDLFAPENGGRPHAISSGYRPVILVSPTDGEQVSIGLCELRLTDDLQPGGSGEGRLAFDVAVSDVAESLLQVGSSFALAEGTHPIGAGRGHRRGALTC
jgi:hypothetical protein